MVHGKRLIKKMAFDFLPSSTVLMFHHIDDGNIIVRSGCRLSKKSFVDILDSGISFISAEEYTQFVFSWKNPCLITFDDGLKDVYRVAYPELKKRNIPFTVFIVTDFLDQEGYLSSKELQVLADDPLVTIGSHGTTHKILHGMDEAEQRMELLDSKHILEEKTEKVYGCLLTPMDSLMTQPCAYCKQKNVTTMLLQQAEVKQIGLRKKQILLFHG